MATTFMTEMADESGSMSCFWQSSVAALGWGYKTRSLVDVNKKKTTLMAWEQLQVAVTTNKSFLMWLLAMAECLPNLPLHPLCYGMEEEEEVIESNAVWSPLTTTNCSSIPLLLTIIDHSHQTLMKEDS